MWKNCTAKVEKSLNVIAMEANLKKTVDITEVT